MQELMPYTNMVGFVLNKLETGTSFAVNVEDTSEQIFIPSQLANMQNIVPGDRINIRAIPNRKPGGAKWFAVFISRLKAEEEPVMPTAEPVREPETPSQVAEQLAPLLEAAPAKPSAEPKRAAGNTENYDAVRKALQDLGGVGTTGEVAAKIGKSTSYTSFYLNSMHQRGELARAGIRKKADQKIDSFVFWAFNAKDLTPFDIEEEAQ